jgi:Phage protein Gp138 N-terminal domain
MNRQEILNDPEVAAQAQSDGLQAKIWTALPAIVAAVDLSRQTVSVQPSIQGVLSDKEDNESLVNLPLLVDVPICWPRAGGFALTLPVTIGDEVLVVFSARAIDSWWQSGGIGAPVESRMHDLSDGFAILAPTSQPKKLSNVQADGIELRTESRSTYIRLTEGAIFIKGNIVHEGNSTQLGNMSRTGTSQTSGSITGAEGLVVTGPITNNGVSIGSAHTHRDVEPGIGNSGPPI